MTLPGVARNTATSCVPANVPDGGDAVLNAALSGVLQAAGMATGQLAAVIGTHAQKLQACHDRYRDVEETNTQLMRQLLGVLDGPS